MSQKTTVPEQLIRHVNQTDPTALPDLLLLMAKNVESAFLEAGAVPEKDYTFRDLFTMGLPFALEVWKQEKTEFFTSNF